MRNHINIFESLYVELQEEAKRYQPYNIIVSYPSANKVITRNGSKLIIPAVNPKQAVAIYLSKNPSFADTLRQTSLMSIFAHPDKDEIARLQRLQNREEPEYWWQKD